MTRQNQNSLEQTHWEYAAKTRLGKYLTRLETDFISKAVDHTNASIVIDVGAEAGRFSLLAAKSNVTVVAIDIDKYSLRRLKKKNDDVIVIQADARKIPFKRNSFDGVFMIEVLDYIPQIGDALGECYRVLKQKAPFVFSFGNQSSLKAKLRGLRGKSYMHSYGAVIKCLAKTGFEIKAKLGYNWLPLGRTSQSRLIPFLVGLEKVFFLRRAPSLSPWVMVHAAKC